MLDKKPLLDTIDNILRTARVRLTDEEILQLLFLKVSIEDAEEKATLGDALLELAGFISMSGDLYEMIKKFFDET